MSVTALKQYDKELKLEIYLRTASKIDINHVVSAWHKKIFSDKSKSPYLKETASVLNEASRLNRRVKFNSTTKKIELDGSHIQSSLMDYTTKVEEELPFAWRQAICSTRGRSRVISQPNSRPHKQHNFLYGLEFEMSSSQDAPTFTGPWRSNFPLTYERVISSLGTPNIGMVKKDSSLDSRGFELVLVPLPFHQLKQAMKALLQNKDVVDDLYVTRNHGVHIHVTKEAFTERQLAYMLYIFNSRVWDKFLCAITGRGERHEYARKATDYFANIPAHLPTILDKMLYSEAPSDNSEGHVSFLDILNRRSSTRGVVAISIRHPTVEFRGFNSTLNPEILTSYLELIASLLEFCSQGSGGVSIAKNNLNPEAYISWLIDKQSKGTTHKLQPRLEYANLIRRIVLDIYPTAFTIEKDSTITRLFPRADILDYPYTVDDVTLSEHGYDEDGYDEHGYDEDGYDEDGYNSEGYNYEGYNSEGYNYDGYDEDGYDSDGYDESGYNREGYDSDGYDRGGYDSDGYNEEGYNCLGFDEDGYDSDGYNEEGLNKAGVSREG